MKGIPQLVLALLAVAALILIDQYVTWSKWWEWKDFGIHHETVFVILVSVALGVWIGVRKRRR
jgi:hypothetical protein